MARSRRRALSPPESHVEVASLLFQERQFSRPGSATSALQQRGWYEGDHRGPSPRVEWGQFTKVIEFYGVRE
jgi:hypothetical protein